MLNHKLVKTGVIFFILFGAPLKAEEIVYRAAITSLPSTFDPAQTRDTSSSTIIMQLFDPLFLRQPNGDIAPALVNHYQLSEDRKRYHFDLKRNIFFHDGKPITSWDVASSIKRQLRYTKSDDRGFGVILGAKAYQLGQTQNLAGLVVTSDRSFDMILENPFPIFIEMLADVTMSIVPMNFESNLKNGKIIGSGPYVFTRRSPEEIILSGFELYWGKVPAIEKIILKIVSSEAEAQKLVTANQLDNTHPFKVSAANSTEWVPYSYFHASVRYLGFNMGWGPLKNLEVRKALISVLPIESYHKRLNQNKEYPISHFVPPGLPGYIPKEWMTPMPKTEAEKILTSTKWNGDLELINYLTEEVGLRGIGEEICQIWQTYKVPCQYKDILLKEFMKRASKGDLGAFIGKLMPHIPDTYQLLAFFKSDFPLNFFYTTDTTIDKLLKQSQRVEAPQIRETLYRQINERISDQLFAIPLQYMGRQTHYVHKQFSLPPIDVTGPFFLRINNIQVLSGGQNVQASH